MDKLHARATCGKAPRPIIGIDEIAIRKERLSDCGQ
jgi:hypothetical protein